MFGFFDRYGERSPRNMPSYFFWGHRRLDYSTAIRADTSKQYFTILPRYWYVDTIYACGRCGEEFCFTAADQQTWYEAYAFYVGSSPRECRSCRSELRRLKSLRQEYDRDIARALTSGDVDLKGRVATVIDQLCEAGEDLPRKILENRGLLARQIARRSGPDAA